MPGNLVKLFCLWPRPAWVINEGMGDVTLLRTLVNNRKMKRIGMTSSECWMTFALPSFWYWICWVSQPMVNWWLRSVSGLRSGTNHIS